MAPYTWRPGTGGRGQMQLRWQCEVGEKDDNSDRGHRDTDHTLGVWVCGEVAYTQLHLLQVTDLVLLLRWATSLFSPCDSPRTINLCCVQRTRIWPRRYPTPTVHTRNGFALLCWLALIKLTGVCQKQMQKKKSLAGLGSAFPLVFLIPMTAPELWPWVKLSKNNC